MSCSQPCICAVIAYIRLLHTELLQAVLACLRLLEHLKLTEQHWGTLRNEQNRMAELEGKRPGSSATLRAWVRIKAGTRMYPPSPQSSTIFL